MASVKHVSEFGGLECGECIYKNYSHCNHPKFERLKVKPLIIAPEGDTYPAFCPKHKESSDGG